MAKLFYILKFKAFIHLYEKFNEITRAYANVEVPENPNEMLRQINSIINSHLEHFDLDKVLIWEIDKYCTAINRSRTLYLQQIGSNNSFCKLELKIVPFTGLRYQSSTEYFQKIVEVRNQLIEDKEFSSLLSDIASIFTDWAGVGRAIYDYSAISQEAAKEVELKTKYLQDVVSSLECSMDKYFEEMEKIVRNQYKVNQNNMKKYVDKIF